MITKKIEKSIRYCEETDTYYVQFNFSPTSTAHLRGFPTLADARKYRDIINAAKLDAKIKKDLAVIYEYEAELMKKYKPYPYNAFDIIGLSENEIELSYVNDFEGILQRACNEREGICIRTYFQYEGTLETIGKELDITKERVRQIISSGTKKISSYIFEQRMHKQLAENLKNIYETYENCPLKSLGLSSRSYNALIKHGVKTVADLLNCTIEELTYIRSLGKKGIREVSDKVRGLGLTFKSEQKNKQN